MKSDLGYKTWMCHKEAGVKICDSQSEWTPMQREFLVLCMEEYMPDESDVPNERP